ncbi:protein E6 [Cajanus cajan]|uniref:Protein E6 n=2 Tax=Cajanus cajan TaxID=3821 RepID=A0A151QQQ4_CAJCA|nr:protein E6 [Cajanus cajan]KYP32584.1 Protein E6 [Cajanus cajan]
MAPLSNYISFLFLTTLVLPLHITARDSQFFSKVTHFNNNNNVKETELPNKEAPEINKPEPQPAFIPETENSYGLYGHDESNELPSNTPTPTSYHPYKAQFEDPTKYPNPKNKYYNNDAYNKKFYNKDAYGGNQYELSDTKYTQEGYNNKYYNNDAANDKYYYNNNRYFHNNNVSDNRYNGEKQGMNDTRFLGGKYFYDVNAEKETNNPTYYGESSRGVNTENWHNNTGNQNQEEFEDEQENFEP